MHCDDGQQLEGGEQASRVKDVGTNAEKERRPAQDMVYGFLNPDEGELLEPRRFFELLNALSMLFPLAIALVYVPRECACWAAFPWGMIVPVSMALHLSVWSGRIDCVIDNDFRRLDQTNQLVSTVFVAWAVGGGLWFISLLACLCAYAVHQVWDDAYTNDGARWKWVAGLVTLSMLPLLYHRLWLTGGCAFASWVVSGLLFCLRHQNPYCHSVFHAGLGVCAMFVCEGAIQRCNLEAL